MTGRSHPIAFPGAIYDADGRSLDPAIPDLRPKEFVAFLHHFLITDRDEVFVTRLWLLADDATARSIPHPVVLEAVQLVLAGQGILILARRPEVEADVRDGLLRALALATVEMEDAGRA